MRGLIKFDLINIFKGISFWICGVLVFFMSITSVGVKAMADVFLYGIQFADLRKIGYSGQMYLLLAPSQSDFPVLIGILATIAVCSGYSDKTYRNILSRGFSRMQVFASKCIAISVASIVYGLFSMLAGFITGTIFWGVGAGWNYMILLSIIVELLVCCAIGLLYVATSFIFKKMGIAIVIAVMTPSLLSIGSTVIDYLCEFNGVDFRVSPLIINNVLFNIGSAPNDSKVLAASFLCFAAYFVSTVFCGYFGMRKDEI